MNERRYKMRHFFLMLFAVMFVTAATVYGTILQHSVFFLILGSIAIGLTIHLAIHVLSRVDFNGGPYE